MSNRRSISHLLHCLLLIFIIYFPKGGFKIGGVPLTWGYLLLALLAILSLQRTRTYFCKPQLYAVLALLPFQIIALIQITTNGFLHTGHLVAFFVSLYALPWIFLILFVDDIAHLQRAHLIRWVAKGVGFTAIFGIVLFFYYLHARKLIAIPYLTINGSDRDSFMVDKFNFRGILFKLISTYNNGNLYGVCMLMLLPLYYLKYNSVFARSILRIALMLTISRTIWAGLVMAEIIYAMYVERKWWKCPFIIGSFVAGLILISFYFHFPIPLSYLFDPKMGGRLADENLLHSLDLFVDRPFLVISEFIYFGILRDFGLIATIAFCCGLLGPVAIYFLNPHLFSHSKEQRAFVAILLIYLMTALSDGAILLIPTMAIYWGCCAIMLAKSGRINVPSSLSTTTI